MLMSESIVCTAQATLVPSGEKTASAAAAVAVANAVGASPEVRVWRMILLRREVERASGARARITRAAGPSSYGVTGCTQAKTGFSGAPRSRGPYARDCRR